MLCPHLGPWPAIMRCTDPAMPRQACSTPSSASTWTIFCVPRRIVPTAPATGSPELMGRAEAEGCGAARSRSWTWAALMRRAFDLDVLRCPQCAGRMELIATIDDPAVIHRILAHLGLPGARDGPAPAVALSPPRDDQATSPFALPSGSRRPAGPGGRLPVATGAPWCRGVPGPPTAAVRPRPWTLAGSPHDGRGVIRAVPSGKTPAVPENRCYVTYDPPRTPRRSSTRWCAPPGCSAARASSCGPFLTKVWRRACTGSRIV